jgi:hypothetical protein
LIVVHGLESLEQTGEGIVLGWEQLLDDDQKEHDRREPLLAIHDFPTRGALLENEMPEVVASSLSVAFQIVNEKVDLFLFPGVRSLVIRHGNALVGLWVDEDVCKGHAESGVNGFALERC